MAELTLYAWKFFKIGKGCVFHESAIIFHLISRMAELTLYAWKFFKNFTGTGGHFIVKHELNMLN